MTRSSASRLCLCLLLVVPWCALCFWLLPEPFALWVYLGSSLAAGGWIMKGNPDE